MMIERTEAPARRVAGVGSGLFLLALRASPDEILRLEDVLAGEGVGIESRTGHAISLP